MSGSVNKVILVGNLGKDPEVVRLDNAGSILVKFSLATSETYTNRNGERVNQTEWHTIVVGKKGLAEVCEKYLHKGMKVYIEGKIQYREYTDKTNQKRYFTEIQADSMTMLTSKEEGRMGSDANNAGSSEGYPPIGLSESSADNESPF
jgi:single-strand DNA-binding protein